MKATGGRRSAAQGTLFRRPAVSRIGALGIAARMGLGLLLIVVGIVLAVLVHYALGIVCILVGLALIIVPRLGGASRA